MTERPSLYQLLGALSEPVRVRILRLLSAEELTVGELASVLQAPQSTVSRHLKTLTQARWIQRRNEGTAAFVRLDAAQLSKDASALWTVVRDAPEDAESAAADRQRMASIIAQRRLDSRTFFGRVATRWSDVRASLYGHGFIQPALMALLSPDLIVADLGCGSGDISAQLAPFIARVLAVDQDPSMLAAARKRLKGFHNIEIIEADLAALPCGDASVDAALLMLVLHYSDAPERVLGEAGRLLRPGGRIILIDMVAHARKEYETTMGHRHLGFSREALVDFGRQSGLSLDRYRVLPADPNAQGPALFVATLTNA